MTANSGAVVLTFPRNARSLRRSAAAAPSFSEFLARQPDWQKQNIENWLRGQLMGVPMPFPSTAYHHYLHPHGFPASSLRLLLRLRDHLWVYGTLPQEPAQLAKLCRVSERTWLKASYAVSLGFSPAIDGEWSDRSLLRQRSIVLRGLERQAMKRFAREDERPEVLHSGGHPATSGGGRGTTA